MSIILPTIKDRVLYIAENKEVSKQDFFRKTGLKYSNFTGKSKESDLNSKSVAEIILIYPEINPVWLLTGLGEMEIGQQSKADEKQSVKNLINAQYFKAKDLMLLLSDNVKFLYVLCKILIKNKYEFSQQEKKKILFYDQLNKEYENVGMGKTALDLETYNHLEFLVREDLFGFVNNLIMKADEILKLDLTFEIDKLFE